MGVKGTCRSANRGGGSFCMLAIYQTGIHSLLLPDSSTAPQGQKGIESGQKVAKVNIYFLAFVFSRYFWRQQTAKSKYILGKWCECVVSCAPFVVCFIVSTWCRRCAPAPSLWVCSVPFSLPLPLSCLACGALHLNMALFRVLRGFLARFGVRMYVCMG